MDSRLIVHYKDGKTYKSDWNEDLDFSEYCEKPISSVQLQTEIGRTYTLSAKKGQASRFWYKKGTIYKRIARDTWIELDTSRDGPNINIVKDKIR